MTDTTPRVGWYPDPAGPGLRLWDGHQWTGWMYGWYPTPSLANAVIDLTSTIDPAPPRSPIHRLAAARRPSRDDVGVDRRASRVVPRFGAATCGRPRDGPPAPREPRAQPPRSKRRRACEAVAPTASFGLATTTWPTLPACS